MNIETTGEATYCPEDNKLRLYVGRVPREEYEILRAQGWTCTPKQSCQFVATWSPERENTALAYGDGVIGDEDQSPADRAADRAERFAGYQEKRMEEAGGKADQYAAGPAVHGYQSQALAERRANRHDMQAARACNLWEKAEYWQSRTAGVIHHALYVSTPGVRMGRILELEADIRKIEKNCTDATKTNQATWDIWNGLAGNSPLIVVGSCVYSLHNQDIKPAGDDGKYTREQCILGMALMMVGNVHCEYGSDRDKLQKTTLAELAQGIKTPEDAAKLWISNHPERPQDWTPGGRWYDHLKARLAYENQMLEAQGGRAAFVEMEAGGWLGKRQIQKVCKSPVTGRVVSVKILVVDNGEWGQHAEKKERIASLNVERLSSEVYRAPTDEERAAFAGAKKAAKDARGVIPTINPTKEDAERFQAQLNAIAAETDKGKNYPRRAGKVEETTQAKYSASYKDHRTVREYNGFKMRVMIHGWSTMESVVVLTDKPQKNLPATAWKQVEERQEAIA
jgi:hypothetical protein